MEDFMLPCLNKKLFGADCLGCGFQRALLLLFNGDLVAAFKMYPAIYTLILFFAFVLLNIRFKFKYSQIIIKVLAIVNIVFIVGNFIIKTI